MSNALFYNSGMSSKDRYQRQVQIQQFGADGQRKLLGSKVMIIGIGGLGCQVAAQLAGAGVGRLSLIDHDEVALSNLHRQILFREADIGQSKVQIAKRELQAINSQIQIEAVQARFGPRLARERIQDFDLIIDAADNLAVSYLASDVCFARRIPLLTASVNRTFGYLGVFCGTHENPEPSLRAVFPQLPRNQLSCETEGVTGPGVGVVANYQAQEALKILLTDNSALLSKLMYLNLWEYQHHTIDFSKAQEPSNQQISLIAAADIEPQDFVIDVRGAEEAEQQPQPFRISTNIPLAELSSAANKITDGSRIVLACSSGQRALSGAQQLQNSGHCNIAVVLPD